MKTYDIERFGDTKMYFFDFPSAIEGKFIGKLHREDGPAVERKNGDNEWWLEGKRITEAEHKRKSKGRGIMRVTDLVMNKWDRPTIKQAQEALKVLNTVDPNEILWDHEKPNYQLAIEKLERTIETAKEKEAAREAKKAEE